VLMRSGLYPPELRSTNLDVDWIYRRMLPVGLRMTASVVERSWRGVRMAGVGGCAVALSLVNRAHGPQGILARTWPTGSMALWAAILLGVSLLLYYYQ
jgi:multicomponent Na+:H+ antiporter subunit D